MSFANFVGDTPLGDATRIDTLITERIKRVSVFQNIDIEGDVDLGLTGRIVGTLGVETPELSTQASTVALLTGTDIQFQGDVEVNGLLSADGGVNVSGGDLQIGAGVNILFDTTSVRMGEGAGGSSNIDAVAIGIRAGKENQGVNAVAIGDQAGELSQGNNAVAIGALAGESNQDNNTIVLNATGSALDTNGTDRLFVKPVRGVAQGVGVGIVIYDPATGELAYSTT